MTEIIRGNEYKTLTEIVQKAFCLLLCGLALLLLAVVASQWLVGKSEAANSTRARTPPLEETYLPQPTQFDILYSAQQRGLMVYNGYIYLLRHGDVLPDGGRVREFQLHDGRWIAVRL